MLHGFFPQRLSWSCLSCREICLSVFKRKEPKAYCPYRHPTTQLVPLLTQDRQHNSQTLPMTVNHPFIVTFFYHQSILHITSWMSNSNSLTSHTSSDTKEPRSPYFTGIHLICSGSICHSVPIQCSPHQGQTHTPQQGLRFSPAFYYCGEKPLGRRTPSQILNISKNCQSLTCS